MPELTKSQDEERRDKVPPNPMPRTCGQEEEGHRKKPCGKAQSQWMAAIH